MLTIRETRSRVGVVIPVYFKPSVDRELVANILERTFLDHTFFCSQENTLVVVDRDSLAESLFRKAGRASALFGLPLHVLDENRGKTGAVREGLSGLLDRTNVPYVVTRDCDGDHLLEDLPRIVSAAEQTGHESDTDMVSVFGVRPSLAKPMNWVRQEWELLTNHVVEDLVSFILAREGSVLDRRYWNGYPLDLQSGYRLYSRTAAAIAAESLRLLPNEPEIYTMACEILPFVELSVRGGIVAQVQRGTWVEQPVSSYAGLPFARCYGRLLVFLTDHYDLPRQAVLRVFDNHLVNCAGYFSETRQDLLECRAWLDPDGGAVQMPQFL